MGSTSIKAPAPREPSQLRRAPHLKIWNSRTDAGVASGPRGTCETCRGRWGSRVCAHHCLDVVSLDEPHGLVTMLGSKALKNVLVGPPRPENDDPSLLVRTGEAFNVWAALQSERGA
jgi:hypothetical protein